MAPAWLRYETQDASMMLPMCAAFVLLQDTVGDKALRVVDGAIFVAKSAPLGTAVKVSF